MKAVVLLLAFSLSWSLQGTTVLGRAVTYGDLGLVLMIPLVILVVWRAASNGRKVFGGAEISMVSLLVVIPVCGFFAQALGSGTFLNGYRSLFLGAVCYFSGRITATERSNVLLACLLVFSGVGAVLYKLRIEIAEFRGGDDVLHLVGFQGEGLGSTINNLNVLGLLWSSIGLLGIPLAAKGIKSDRLVWPIVGLVMMALVVPGVMYSFSRSAYSHFAVGILGFLLLQTFSRKKGLAIGVAAASGCLVIGLAIALISDFSFLSFNRVANKYSEFGGEILGRSADLMWSPVVEFLATAPIQAILIGDFESPQHSSPAHYFIMFGAIGFIFYMTCQWFMVYDGIFIARQLPRAFRVERFVCAFSSFVWVFLFFNDCGTNLLFYSPTFAYLSFFVVGLCRPFIKRTTLPRKPVNGI